jgi:hypothetical protein
MIQEKRVAGQARCRLRTTGNTWQVSPMAESRRMQTLSGGMMEAVGITLLVVYRYSCMYLPSTAAVLHS